MKRILFATILLIVFTLDMQAQNAFSGYLGVNSGNAAKEGQVIKNRTFTSSTCDTTYWLDISKFNTVYVSLQAKDEVTILISHQLSLDTVCSPVKLQDSLKLYTSQGDTIKTVNYSTIAAGCKFIRWIFQVTDTFPVGTTTPKYTAIWKAAQ